MQNSFLTVKMKRVQIGILNWGYKMTLSSIVLTTLMVLVGGFILFFMFSFIFYKVKDKSSYKSKKISA